MTSTKNIFVLMPLVATMASCSLVMGGKETLPKPSTAVEVNPFNEVAVPFSHTWNDEIDYPYTGAAAIDIEGDGKQELFIGGGDGQADVLLSYQDGKLVDVIDGTGLSNNATAHGVTSVDIDNDADTDLIVVRSGSVMLYHNEGGKFTESKLAVDIAADTVPLSVAVGDINQDGLVDLYISNFVSPAKFVASTFNNPEHSKTNQMLLNQGNGEFADITEKSGTKGTYNSFHAAFIHLNADAYPDLVVAQNTGKIEIFKNNGDETFSAAGFDSGLGYWMGLGAGDIDQDGDLDLVLSNVGNSIPTKFLRGDLTENQTLNQNFALLINQGDFNFTQGTSDYKLGGLGFGWGSVFEDINLDGELDLLAAQNYVKWPKHKYFKLPGKAMLQLTDSDGKPAFYQVDDLNLDNKNFGQSPLIVDLNGDSKPDVVMVNMTDDQKAYINQSANSAVKLTLPDNAAYLGAKATATLKSGKTITRSFNANMGLMTDSSNELFFAVAPDDAVVDIVVTKSNGDEERIEAPANGASVVLAN